MDEVSMTLSLGGDEGGVSGPRSGKGPGGQAGRCLFGTATGVPREDVFRVRCGGGVEARFGMDGARATMAAMVANAVCARVGGNGRTADGEARWLYASEH
jgi:hypothetical protein